MTGISRLSLALIASLGLTACGQAPLTDPDLAEPVHRLESAPPGAPAGTCWAQDITPAVVETVTEQVLLQPAERLSDGTVVEPAVYKTETRQKIINERRETWFETPCPADLTPQFIASVQRALQARGHYVGQINGRLDARTQASVRAFQKTNGLNSGTLSLASARQLGLIAIPRDQIDG